MIHDSESTARIRILARIALVWACLILIKLVYLQVVHHSDFARMGRNQQHVEMQIQGPRGTIFDSSGLPLAKSLPVDSVCVNPLRVPDVATAAELLSPVLGLDPVEVYSQIETAAENKRGFVWIKRRITPDESARLRSMKLDWVEFRNDSRRFYPNGSLAAHVIGSVNHDEHGNGGLELSLDEDLAGRAGEVRKFRDSRHNSYGEEVETEPLPGKDLYTSINSHIQHIAEKSLAEAVAQSHAKTGSVVVIDPKTGYILAMANVPTFDPNLPPEPGESMATRNNLAVTSPYEPGSVMKTSTLAIALDLKKVTPDTIINCGALRIGNHVYKESHAGYYGSLSATDVLVKSSNLGAIQIGMRVGADNMQEYVRRLGFGAKTGIELPGEDPGRVRKKWSTMTLASVSMGHEVMVTALQLAQLGAIVANGGWRVKPHIVIKKQRPGEAPEVVPQEAPVRVLNPDTVIKLRTMMEGVVLRGTARGKANLIGYRSGGKTGTAMIYNAAIGQYTHFYNGSFLGFAPVQDPSIVVAVTLNGTSGTAGYGGQIAAPVFREVATTALRILDVPKDASEDAPVVAADKSAKTDSDDVAIAGLATSEMNELVSSDPQMLVQGPAAPDQHLFPVVARHTGGPRVPNFQGKSMRDVLEQAAAGGMPVEVIGNGVARLQMPPPGAELPPGEKVRVQFGR